MSFLRAFQQLGLPPDALEFVLVDDASEPSQQIPAMFQQFLTGDPMLIKRAVFDKIGVFDPRSRKVGLDTARGVPWVRSDRLWQTPQRTGAIRGDFVAPITPDPAICRMI